ELLGLTNDLIDLAEKAGEESTSDNQRKSLDRKFQDTVEDFNDTLDEAAKKGVNFLDKDELSSILQFAGIDTNKADSIAGTFQKLAGKDSILGFESVDGSSVRYNKRIKTTETVEVKNVQITDEANNSGTGITFAKYTSSSTNNIVLTTEGTYTGNSSGYSVTALYDSDSNQTILSDIADEDQRVIDNGLNSTAVLVATGDGDGSVLQIYTYTGTTAGFYSTIGTTDSAVDEVVADVSNSFSYAAYATDGGTTLFYGNALGTITNNITVSGGTISQVEVTDAGQVYFTSNATSLGGDGVNDELYYFDGTTGSPTVNNITNLLSGSYTSESASRIESFKVSQDGTRIAFVVNEGADNTALDQGLQKELIVADLDQGVGNNDFVRFEDYTGRTVATPTGSTNDYLSFDFDFNSNYIFVSSTEIGGDADSYGIRRYDITDINSPTHYDVEATGTFTTQVTAAAGEDVTTEIQLVDLNNDGLLDYVGNYTPTTGGTSIGYFAINNGDGTYSTLSEFGTLAADQTGSSTIGIGDIDGDGYADAVYSNGNGEIVYALNEGGGALTQQDTLIGFAYSDTIRLADIDNDGDLDIIGSSQSGGTTYVNYAINEAGTFDGVFTVTLASGGDNNFATDLQLADLNGDGNLDIISLESTINGTEESISITTALGDGEGGFGASQNAQLVGPNEIGFKSGELAVGDFNEDGVNDIAFTYGGPEQGFAVAYGDGDGTFSGATSFVFLGNGGTGALDIADVDNDGHLDILFNNNDAASSGIVYVYNGDGAGSFANSQTFDGGSGEILTAGDIDLDGAIDVISKTSGESLQLTRGNTSQTVETGTFSSTSTITESTIQSISYPGTVSAITTEAAFLFDTIGDAQFADVNGDGILDVVGTFSDTYTLNTTQDGVVVFLGQGDGTFGNTATSTILADDALIDDITIGDFNNDGRDDVVYRVATKLFIATGNADGTFTVTSSTQFASAGFDTSSDIASGDIDGDGNVDLIDSGYVNIGGVGAFNVRLGNGDGTFNAAISYTTGIQSGLSIIVDDVDGDGANDVFAYNGNDIQLYTNQDDGFGTLTSSGVTKTYSTNNIDKLILADIDNDNDLDIITSESSGATYYVRIGENTGNFSSPLTTADTGTGTIYDIAVGDLNNDGNLDLVTRLEDSGEFTRIREGDGTGSFATVITNVDESGSPAFGKYILIADINSDNAGDLVNIQGIGKSTYSGSGAVNAVQIRLGEVDSTDTTQISAAEFYDVDGDGILDAVLGANSSTNTRQAILLGNADGTFDSAITYDRGTAGTVTDLEFYDFSNDGNADLITFALGAGAGDGTAILNANAGSGTFSAGTSFTSSDDIYSGTLADVNGDGNIDLITAGQEAGSGEVRVFTGDGTGTFNTTASITLQSETVNTYAVESFDIDGDGDNDLITVGVEGSSAGTIGVRLNNGTGTFGAYQTISLGGTISELDPDLEVSDLNGDGYLDFVVGGTDASGNGFTTVVLNNGTGSFSVGESYSPETAGSSEVTDIALVDVNSDGKLDLLTSETIGGTSQQTSVRLGLGDGTFTESRTVAAGTGAESFIVATDIDSDGQKDLVSIQNIADGIVQATVRDSVTGSAEFNLRTAAEQVTNLSADAEVTGLFSFVTSRSGQEELVGSIVQPTYQRQLSAYGLVVNDAQTFYTSPQGENGSSSIENLTLGAAAAGAVYTTTANYASTNPNNQVGFTLQTIGIAGAEGVKLEASVDNQVLDVESTGTYAIIKDFQGDDSTLYSLKVIDLETEAEVFEVPGYYDTDGSAISSATITGTGTTLVAFTTEDDSSSVYFASETSPGSIASYTISGGEVLGGVEGSSTNVVFATDNSDAPENLFNNTIIAFTSGGNGYTTYSEVKYVNLNDTDRNIATDSYSVSGDGAVIAVTSEDTGEVFLIDTAAPTPTAQSIELVDAIDTALSSDGTRLAVLRDTGGTFHVDLYDVTLGTFAISLADSTTLADTTVSASGLTISPDGNKVGVITNNGSYSEFVAALDPTQTTTDTVFTTTRRTVSSGTTGPVNPLNSNIQSLGTGLLATETLRFLEDEIKDDLEDLTSILTEISTSLQAKRGDGRSIEDLQKDAQDIAAQIRGSSLENLLLTNQIDANTARVLLED
ncbi:MAG: VCBS repeat-containing protein, partial [Bdellovibrionales bacterium]|nr:VCBS repeat-containing protein [Bdellovibrionales bacterium]